MTSLDPDYRHRMTRRFSEVLLALFSVGAAARLFVLLSSLLFWHRRR